MISFAKPKIETDNNDDYKGTWKPGVSLALCDV